MGISIVSPISFAWEGSRGFFSSGRCLAAIPRFRSSRKEDTLQPESVHKIKHSDLFELCNWSQLSPALRRSSILLFVFPEEAVLGLLGSGTVGP